MRKMLAILAVFHLVLLGCSTETITPTETEELRVAADPGPTGPPSAAVTDEPLVTFWVDGDSVNVMQYDIDSVAREVAYHIERIDPAQQEYYYSVVNGVNPDENGVITYSSNFFDNQGTLLVGIDYAWPAHDPDPDWFSVTERTLMDEMTIRRETENGKVTETYTLNGETRTYIYAETQSNMAKSGPGTNGGGEPDYENELPLPSEAFEELTRWESLVDPENTLNYNQDGEFFIKVLTNEDFQAWAAAENDALGKPTIDPRALCGLAGIGSLKCFFPPYLGNLICTVSAGIGLACSIAGLAFLF